MSKRYVVLAVALAASMFSLPARSQSTLEPGTSQHVDGWYKDVPAPPKDEKPGLAPHHDLSGIWEPAAGWREGVQQYGALEYPSDGKLEHQLPFTPLGEKTWKSHKPGFGTTEVPIALNNDPFDVCDPIGFPRIELFGFRAIQILQTEKEVVIFYQNDRTFRTIWTDGRDFPPDDIAEPRWYGYSIGKWVDDTTLVVETTELDERTWLDNAGRPHSSDLRVEERFHRVNHDIFELTLTINDPKMYTKPWIALNKFPMRLQPADFDLREMLCSPSEQAQYDNVVSKPTVGNSTKK
jgi:hypothetical protein